MRKTILTILFFIPVCIYAQHVCIDIEAQNKNIKSGANISYGIASDNYLWQQGQTLRVKFLGGTYYLQQQVKKHAKEWEKHGNIKFNFISSGYAEIRISFNKGGSWSYIGKGSMQVSQSQASMNYGWFNSYTSESEFRRTIMHEFGHALGLLHEHKHSARPFEWNEAKVLAYYTQKLGWTRNNVYLHVINRYGRNSNHSNSRYDKYSIMHYHVPPEFTTNGYSVPWNTYLSQGDKQLIAKLYPGKLTTTKTKKITGTTTTTTTYKKKKKTSSNYTYTKGSFTDTRDNQTYKWVKIANQVWMAENLNYDAQNSLCCHKDPSYGKLYKLKTAMNACPPGWRLPTADEASTMIRQIGDWVLGLQPELVKSMSDKGLAFKYAGFYKNGGLKYKDEIFCFWTSTKDNSYEGCNGAIFIQKNGSILNRPQYPSRGLSVRCIKNNN